MSNLTHQQENPKAFMDRDGTPKPSMMVHACNLARRGMGQEEQEFKVSLGYLESPREDKQKQRAMKLRV